ncbi:hypothetical protein E2C01_094278 [Portunus trituberculatus]|uniref:Uncharacterized protein n=1 Tax=Portunus trituberculatus TaxID=210409 RepID=A0A5B7JS13_PORTR|nr:hypothetical protein [Portunus trituberculatus]
MRNVRLHARHYHLRHVFSTQRWVSDMETVIIPRKISIIPPQVPPPGISKMPDAPPLWEILRRDWKDRTRNKNEIGDSISRRIRGEEEIKNVGRVSKTVRDTSRVLHQLL